ncbi:hypothetical protein BJ546DRAFT_1060267 [Cryomyces antarcticus]|uniref:Major facilitator superfamily (MFS) profile domain-containing protein n=1 Tax=Cryomyces antarcticus TaxID=329879 RepID=A0ABR0LNW8_9PEZI|nr:hypothetical protein LTR60_003085 [Cryomyces antarcticus]KAK5015244.1 hypothetical protein LTR39_002719 [Cryomyces antarcticus]KAK5201227.1 hypothetical protein LTR16_003408 [Cryomyces antarcticus]
MASTKPQLNYSEDVAPASQDSVGELADRVAIHTETYNIDESALGHDLPKHYYLSPGFIGTVVALCLGNISNYLGWTMPSNSLLLINESIGPSSNIGWVALSYTLGLSVAFLIVGRLSDIFGRRWLGYWTLQIRTLASCVVQAFLAVLT